MQFLPKYFEIYFEIFRKLQNSKYFKINFEIFRKKLHNAISFEIFRIYKFADAHRYYLHFGNLRTHRGKQLAVRGYLTATITYFCPCKVHIDPGTHHYFPTGPSPGAPNFQTSWPGRVDLPSIRCYYGFSSPGT